MLKKEKASTKQKKWHSSCDSQLERMERKPTRPRRVVTSPQAPKPYMPPMEARPRIISDIVLPPRQVSFRQITNRSPPPLAHFYQRNLPATATALVSQTALPRDMPVLDGPMQARLNYNQSRASSTIVSSVTKNQSDQTTPPQPVQKRTRTSRSLSRASATTCKPVTNSQPVLPSADLRSSAVTLSQTSQNQQAKAVYVVNQPAQSVGSHKQPIPSATALSNCAINQTTSAPPIHSQPEQLAYMQHRTQADRELLQWMQSLRIQRPRGRRHQTVLYYANRPAVKVTFINADRARLVCRNVVCTVHLIPPSTPVSKHNVG